MKINYSGYEWENDIGDILKLFFFVKLFSFFLFGNIDCRFLGFDFILYVCFEFVS